MAEELRELLIGDWWRYAISLLGTLMLAVGTGSVFLDGQLTEEELLQAGALLAFCLALIAVGARIALVIHEYNEMGLVLGWMSLGILVLGTMGLWAALVFPTINTPFGGALVLLSVLAGGALFGAIIGYYDVRVRGLIRQASHEQARREFLDEQQETLSSLNGILRHQILNDLAAISGRAELLDAGKLDTGRASDSIIDHCEQMDETVTRIETLVDILTHAGEPREFPLSDALARGRDVAAESEPALTVNGIDAVETTVWADELLHLCFAELFENSAVHGDGNVNVAVRTEPERVTVEVSDTGDGVTLDRERLFEPNSRGTDSDGDGLGLYFAALIVDRYDGEIALRTTDPESVFTVALPTPTIETEQTL